MFARFARLAAALLAVAFIAPAAIAAPAKPALTYAPVELKLRDGTVLAAEEGTFEVAEDRNDPRSRRIPIRFVRLKSTNPNPGSPIVYLAGGPGGAGTDTFKGPRQPVFLALRAVADVIVYDQRGTGRSNSIPPCTAKAPFDLKQTLSEAAYTAYYKATMDQCLGEWASAGVAIKGYTTVQSADDLEDLRRVLGAKKIDLWGISYGTHLALATMRRHPGSIGRVAMASVEGLGQTVKLPAHFDKALERIAVAGGDPTLLDTMRRVYARYDAQPQTATGTLRDGTSFSYTMDSFVLRILASALPKNPDGIPRLIGTYASLDKEGPGRVATFIYVNFLAEPLTFGGMGEAMDIASGIDDERLALVNAQAKTALLGRAANAPMPQLRYAIPGIDLGPDFRKEIRSDLPVLVFSGDLDIRTPLEEQAVAIAGLSNRGQIIVRNGGHDLFEAHPDVGPILVDFFSGKPVTVKELLLPPPPRAKG